jgi:ABC-2 type transport system ATP-binding protein
LLQKAGSTELTVETRDVRLDYGDLTAVNNVNLQIGPGEIYGLVGPNGAGKSSLLKMLANLNRPTYGEIFINGIDLAENHWSVQRDVGYMPYLSPVAPELKV